MLLIPVTQKTNVIEIWVNIDNIISFAPTATGTTLRFNGGVPPSIEVKEDLEEVLRRIANAGKDQRSE